MENWKRELYGLVSDARESCAGCSITDKNIVLRKIGRALSRARILNVPQLIIATLEEAMSFMEQAKTYNDRLPTDNILCSLLNNELSE